MRKRPRAAPITLRIDSLDPGGHGVARDAEGKVVFVEGGLPGERVTAELIRHKKRFALAQALEIGDPFYGRRTPHCRYFGVCGGCVTQHADTRTQVAAKQRGLEEGFARIGKVRPGRMLPIVYGAEWRYRHRARLTARRVAGKGGVLVGFHERRSSYVADMASCEVLPEAVSRLIPSLRETIESLSIRDRVPQIEVAVGDRVTALVLRNLEGLNSQDEQAVRDFAERHGVWVWLQPGGLDTAAPFHPADGPVLDYVLPEFDLRIGFRPTDFTQVNHDVNRILVSRAMRLLGPRPGDRVADLFCGLGNFTLPIARLGASVTGFEGDAALLDRAAQNAGNNGLHDRIQTVQADLFAPGAGALVRRGPFDKLLIDPPRDGAAEIVRSLPPDWPRRIVYVSCDPGTLARDAGTLVHQQGFRFEAAGVVNMFPHTAHVESIALFERT